MATAVATITVSTKLLFISKLLVGRIRVGLKVGSDL